MPKANDPAPDPSDLVTIGQAADELGVQLWRLRRLYDRGILAELPRVANRRVLRRSQVPELREKLKGLGLLK